MRFEKSGGTEYRVTGKHRRVINAGTAASVFVGSGATCVRVPATKQEARFEMTQETRDGIPLCFKGVVTYRVVDPVAAATMLDFTGAGLERIRAVISHTCLNELRATAARLAIGACIEQRRTTLIDAVRRALTTVVSEGGGSGIELDVIQLAQVVLVDEELVAGRNPE